MASPKKISLLGNLSMTAMILFYSPQPTTKIVFIKKNNDAENIKMISAGNLKLCQKKLEHESITKY